MTSPSKRRDMDIMKLMMTEFEVHIPDESAMYEFLVTFPGPKDTPYEGGIWKVQVGLPMEYPYKSPSIGFTNRIFHPNVDESSGTVCLDVINQTWSPMFDLVNIFTMFLPQLLSYPNPSDPLNREAASLYLKDPNKYHAKIKETVALYASEAVFMSESDDEEGKRSSVRAKAKSFNSRCSSPRTAAISSVNTGDADGDESDVSEMSDLGA
mmetsp:Transcript_18468/g.27276  ORF Transcript_18468/g.27276 Transcript_18468/m.27276 type:complete len:210 (+) Transcript_18468:211-840(+)